MRRQHLAVGVSPWNPIASPEPRRRRQQSSLVLDCKQARARPGQSVSGGLPPKALQDAKDKHYPKGDRINRIVPGRQPGGSSKPRMRRQHLAVGVSPWNPIASPEPRRRRQQSSLVLDCKQARARPGQSVSGGLPPKALQDAKDKHYPKGDRINRIVPGRQPGGSSKPRMRRQHLAVGVSPWNPIASPEPRRRRQQSSLVFDPKQAQARPAQSVP